MTRLMKDSGVEWIGKIPNEWVIERIGSLFKNRNEKVSDVDYEPLSVTKNGIVKQLETAAKSNDHSNRKKVCINDFVINSRSDRKMSSGVSKLEGSVSLINTVLYSDKMDPLYVNYLLKNYGFAEEFYRWGTGIVADLWSTNYERMKKIPIPYPQLDEQRKIANFLTEKTSQINSIIENTKISVEEFKKYKKSLITEIVTKGMHNNVGMKDSGIEWIGEVPENWTITSISTICFVTKLAGFEYTDYMANNIRENGDVPIVRAQNVKMGKFIDNINEFIDMNLSEKLNRCALNTKCLLMTFIGAGIGETAIFEKPNRYHLAPNVAKIVIREDKKQFLLEEYLLYFLMSTAGQVEIDKIKKATAQPSLSMETIRSIKILVPDNIQKQLEIVEYLDVKCAQIDKLIEYKLKIINELEEYKKSLIYEYVTGKKEVL